MKGLEELKAVFTDDRTHIAIGAILSLEIAVDKSVARANVEIFPERREIIARMAWDSVGPNSGFFTLPNVGDLVLIAFADGDDDQAFVIKRLTSKEDKMPANVITGDSVLKALAGKKAWITSDSKINLSKGDSAPTENAVLGQVFKTYASELLGIFKDVLTELKTETHLGNLGFKTGVPTNASAYNDKKTEVEALKASPIDDSAILSDLTFTEK